MKELFMIIIGFIVGFGSNVFLVRLNFKQRTIENKIKVCDSIIAHWVRMRNFIWSKIPGNPAVDSKFDEMYGSSQTFLGEMVLITKDEKLLEDTNTLNEKLYRTEWGKLGRDKVGGMLESIKKEAIGIISRMRKDIKDSTRFTLTEFLHMLGLERNKVVRIIAREWLILLGIIAVGILIILFGYSTKFIPVKLTISLFKDTDAAILVKYALMVQILNFGRLVAVYGYPVYLLIRFIIWAIKTLREK